MATIFSKIIKGEIPSYKIMEDERYFAFLDINPLVKGHALVIPKKEVDYIFDVDDNTLAGMMVFAKRVAIAIEKVIPCKRVGVAVLGLEVPHAHIHLVPLNSEADISFQKPRVKLTPEEFMELAKDISSALS
jgi:histidine triad (HIT) family protein